MNQGRMKSAAIRLATLAARNRVGWWMVFWVWALRRGSAIHPIDLAYGIRTSRELPPYLIAPHADLIGQINPYGGCHPNCVRRAIEMLPRIEASTFFDFGCGRGRALVVASEYPFRALAGIDLSGDLCASARTNAAAVARRYPKRPLIKVIGGDATQVKLPDGPLVVFLYDPFGAAVLARVIDKLEAAVNSGQDITIIYENPVSGHLFDASPVFTRWHGEQIACQPEERRHHPDPDDAVVIWQSGSVDGTAPGRETDFDIVVVTPGRRAEVVPRTAPPRMA